MAKEKPITRSIVVTLIEKLPKVIITTTLLIGVIRCKKEDLPKMVENLVKSNVFAWAGWIVAIVLLIMALFAIYIWCLVNKRKNE